MPDKKLTPAQIEEILALKEAMEAEGKPFYYSRIGKMYGVSGITVRRNIAPNEYDSKPKTRAPVKYDPEVAKEKRKSIRIYQIKASKKSKTDLQIIEKLDSLKNKQRYIKELILKDIHSKKR